MNARDIELLYDYNQWANAQLLQIVEKLTPEQFVRDLGNSYRSVRDTLTHVLSSEWIWLMRWKGLSPTSVIGPEEIPNFQTLHKRWREIEMDQRNFLSKISDESLQEMVSYENLKGETWEYTLANMMQHLVNHSTYHRGQVITLLKQLGAEVTPLDFLIFIDNRTA